MRKKLLFIIIPIAFVLFFYASVAGKTRGKLVFTDHLDEVAVTVDGEDILMSDLRFYILFEENKVEEQAIIYNADSTKDYWNAHTNGRFVQGVAKEAVIGMAIHDRIMYNLAMDAHVVLGPDEKEAMEQARTRFWDSLFEGQLEKLPLSYEEGNRIIKEIALAEAYQYRLAREMDTVFAGLVWDGYDFEKILKEHDVRINEDLWERVIIGDISLTHDSVNYINGLTNEDKERIRENK